MEPQNPEILDYATAKRKYRVLDACFRIHAVVLLLLSGGEILFYWNPWSGWNHSRKYWQDPAVLVMWSGYGDLNLVVLTINIILYLTSLYLETRPGRYSPSWYWGVVMLHGFITLSLFGRMPSA